MENKNLKRKILACIFAALFLFSSLYGIRDSFAFGGCEEDCLKCHGLNESEVKLLLDKSNLKDAKILKIQVSPVKGLWEVAVENKEKRGVIYIDFSKKYLVAGQILEVNTNAAVDKTRQRIDELNKDKKINPANIPIKGALVLGSNTASRKVIVFTDPD